MAYRNYIRTSAKAKWSWYLTLAAINLLLFTIILHRFAALYTPAALALFAVAFIIVGVAVMLALWAVMQIWRRGFLGIGTAAMTLLSAVIIAAGPVFFVPKLLALPPLNDVTTDTTTPPSFEVLAEQRGAGANTVMYPKEKFANDQAQAYPDVQPLILDRSTQEAYDLIQDAIARMRWRVVSKQAPGKDGSAGWIEAVDKTLVVGFVDDIVVRVAGDETTARVDMRSASRYGVHDLGRNATRIRALFEEVKTSLAIGEQAVRLKAEIQRHQAEKVREAERRRQEKARLAAQEAAEFERIVQERREALQPQVREANTEAFSQPKKRKPKRRRRRRIRNDIDSWNNLIN